MRGRKFTGDEVRSIRRDLDMGVKLSALSSRFGVTGWAIENIANFRTWNDPKYIPSAFCHECGGKIAANEEGTIGLCVRCGADYFGKLPIR
jgi:rRNA maturation endonuclease Nob1